MSQQKFGPDRFSRFDVYWIQTDRQTNRQAKFIYRLVCHYSGFLWYPCRQPVRWACCGKVDQREYPNLQGGGYCCLPRRRRSQGKIFYVPYKTVTTNYSLVVESFNCFVKNLMELGENIFRYITYPASFYMKNHIFLKQKTRKKYI